MPRFWSLTFMLAPHRIQAALLRIAPRLRMDFGPPAAVLRSHAVRVHRDPRSQQGQPGPPLRPNTCSSRSSSSPTSRKPRPGPVPSLVGRETRCARSASRAWSCRCRLRSSCFFQPLYESDRCVRLHPRRGHRSQASAGFELIPLLVPLPVHPLGWRRHAAQRPCTVRLGDILPIWEGIPQLLTTALPILDTANPARPTGRATTTFLGIPLCCISRLSTRSRRRSLTQDAQRSLLHSGASPPAGRGARRRPTLLAIPLGIIAVLFVLGFCGTSTARPRSYRRSCSDECRRYIQRNSNCKPRTSFCARASPPWNPSWWRFKRTQTPRWRQRQGAPTGSTACILDLNKLMERNLVPTRCVWRCRAVRSVIWRYQANQSAVWRGSASTVSVVIPVKDGERYLGRAARRARSRGSRKRPLVIDSAPRDRSTLIVRSAGVERLQFEPKPVRRTGAHATSALSAVPRMSPSASAHKTPHLARVGWRPTARRSRLTGYVGAAYGPHLPRPTPAR